MLNSPTPPFAYFNKSCSHFSLLPHPHVYHAIPLTCHSWLNLYLIRRSAHLPWGNPTPYSFSSMVSLRTIRGLALNLIFSFVCWSSLKTLWYCANVWKFLLLRRNPDHAVDMSLLSWLKFQMILSGCPDATFILYLSFVISWIFFSLLLENIQCAVQCVMCISFFSLSFETQNLLKLRFSAHFTY